MKKFMVFFLIIGGLYQYAGDKIGLQPLLNYAKRHPEKPWASQVYYSVGMIYYQQSQLPKSQEVLTTLLTDFPTGQYTARALLRLSEVAYDNRDYATTRTMIERFLEEYPDHPGVDMAIKRRELLYNK